MAPSSKSEKDDSKHKLQRKHKGHVVKLLTRGKVGIHNFAPKVEMLRNGGSFVEASPVFGVAISYLLTSSVANQQNNRETGG